MGTVSGVEEVIDQEEGVALNAIKRVISQDNALMGTVVLLKETTGETMIMAAIEGTTIQGTKVVGIVLILQNVRITANQTLVLAQDHQNAALKREVFRDLILQSTTGKLMIVVATVVVLSRMQAVVEAEVEVAIRKGLLEEKAQAEVQEVVPDRICEDI